MEASINSGGGEVRRVKVIYFLSRDGRVEHPHLLQIHRLRRDRVHLRDVKRWLSEVRGKEMPESFSWSYKRRYRGGYIWQDLKENDLITPFADNEYVLKGSDLLPTISTPKKESRLSPVAEKTPKAWTAAENAAEVAAGAETLPVPQRDEQISPKPPPEIDGEYSSETLDESLCREMAMVLKQREEEEPNDGEVEDKRGAYFADGCRNQNINGGNSKKSNKRKAKRMLRNILGCKSAHQTSDDALRSRSRQRQGKKRSGGGGGGEGDANLRAGEMSGGSAGGGGNMWRKTGKQESPTVNKQPAAMATCSQCGKAFYPTKLHSHMQSCKGLARRGT